MLFSLRVGITCEECGELKKIWEYPSYRVRFRNQPNRAGFKNKCLECREYEQGDMVPLNPVKPVKKKVKQPKRSEGPIRAEDSLRCGHCCRLLARSAYFSDYLDECKECLKNA